MKCDQCGMTPSFGLISKKNGVAVCNVCELVRKYHHWDNEPPKWKFWSWLKWSKKFHS